MMENTKIDSFINFEAVEAEAKRLNEILDQLIAKARLLRNEIGARVSDMSEYAQSIASKNSAQ